MKNISFFIEEHIITYSINWLGIETITVNGIIASKKLSLPNRKHSFRLTIEGNVNDFYVKSKQSFTYSTIDVMLYQNGELIETKVLELYKINSTATDEQGSSFLVGLLFVVLSLCFDWHKFFLFIGLTLLFYTFSVKPNHMNSSQDQKDLEKFE